MSYCTSKREREREMSDKNAILLFNTRPSSSYRACIRSMPRLVSSCLSHGAARLLSFTVSSWLASLRLAKCSYLLGLPRTVLRRVICSWKWRTRKVEYDSRILGTAGPSCLPLVRVLLESSGRCRSLRPFPLIPRNIP